MSLKVLFLLLILFGCGNPAIPEVRPSRGRSESTPSAQKKGTVVLVPVKSDNGTPKTAPDEMPSKDPKEPDEMPSDSGDTDVGDTDAGDTDDGDADAGDKDAGDADDGDTDDGDTDDGDTDDGDTDDGDTDDGDADDGDADDGDTDGGDTDDDDTDGGDTDDDEPVNFEVSCTIALRSQSSGVIIQFYSGLGQAATLSGALASAEEKAWGTCEDARQRHLYPSILKCIPYICHTD